MGYGLKSCMQSGTDMLLSSDRISTDPVELSLPMPATTIMKRPRPTWQPGWPLMQAGQASASWLGQSAKRRQWVWAVS